jgi:hypothetical protein
MIDLSITTSQRMHLFVQSVTSIQERIQGFYPKTIYHYDDSSCEEERAEMQYLLRHLFKPKRMITRFYDKYDFKDGHRHSRIMQDWKYDMAHSNSRYVLHTEDDWMFIEDVNINLAIENLKNKRTAMLGFTEPLRNFPESISSCIEQTEDTWKWYFSKEHLLLEPMFIDEVASEVLYDKAPIMWQNKPAFNLKPAIFDNAKLVRMKNFEAIPRINGMIVPFKLEFGLRFDKVFDSWFYKKCFCVNLGNEQSAYTINRSNK